MDIIQEIMEAIDELTSRLVDAYFDGKPVRFPLQQAEPYEGLRG